MLPGKFVVVVMTVLLGVSLPLQAAQTTLVAVASNFQLPAKQLAQAYYHETGNKLRISSGSTGKLYAQIVNGAPFAVFLAANSREPARLEKENRIVRGSRFTYALGKLLLWSVDTEFLKQDLQDLLQAGQIRSISLANPQTAPYGEAGMQVLARFTNSDISAYRTIRAENVSQAFQYAATGAAQTGFIAYSQFLGLPADSKGSYWMVPQQLYRPIEQQAVLLKTAADDPVARDFIRFMQSREGREMIQGFGYGVPE